MSKSAFPEDDLPCHRTRSPPEPDRVPQRPAVLRSCPLSVTPLFTSPLSAHLQSLPNRMRATQQARTTQQAAFDLEPTTILVPHIEAFLYDLGSMPEAPRPPN